MFYRFKILQTLYYIMSCYSNSRFCYFMSSSQYRYKFKQNNKRIVFSYLDFSQTLLFNKIVSLI